jgi:thiosulfate/3-mercaptopyruvate sulfurtransferase
MDALVKTEWLANELGAADLRVVDASYFLPADARDPAAEYEAGHIPNAVFMDLGGLVDSASDLPMMLPSPEKFASRMQSLGIGDGSRIVLYDDSPYKSAARAWWMLTAVFGAHGVAILDGGLAKWKTEGRALETGKQAVRHRHFTVWKSGKPIRNKAHILANLDSKAEQVVDARGTLRFLGEEQDPRSGVAAGHIPGSFNLPYGAMFNADGTWKTGDAMKAAFEETGINMSKPIVATCGSGLTAATLVFGAYLIGKSDVALYDGSWSDWGTDPNTPKAMGAT